MHLDKSLMTGIEQPESSNKYLKSCTKNWETSIRRQYH